MDHQHNIQLDKKVRGVFKDLAKKRVFKENEMGVKEITEAFREGDITITLFFWDALWADPINTNYTYVDYCQTCKKFHLYTKQEQVAAGMILPS